MKKYRIFDAHAHYDDEAFDEDRSEVIKELEEFGILGVLNCGSSLDTSKTSVELSNKYNFFHAAVGVHPENAEEINEKTLKEIERLSENEKVKAIGEIGLDYYYEENPKRDIQIKAFKKQMELAEKLNLPVVIHDRDAHKDTLDIIKQFSNVKGEVHCFSGSVEFAKQCVDLGYYIGVTGVVTFKNAKKIYKPQYKYDSVQPEDFSKGIMNAFNACSSRIENQNFLEVLFDSVFKKEDVSKPKLNVLKGVKKD